MMDGLRDAGEWMDIKLALSKTEVDTQLTRLKGAATKPASIDPFLDRTIMHQIEHAPGGELW